MTITKTTLNGTVTMKLEGRLDTTTAPQLDKEIAALDSSAEKLVLDMEGLEYVSSAGLRVILTAHKKMSAAGGLKLVKVCSVVMEVFDITGFADILDIE